MFSPFAAFANSLLRIPVVQPGFTIDPETGNVIPTTEIFEVKAKLSVADSKEENRPDIPADHINDLFLKGHLVEPMLFPFNITLPIECEAVIDGVVGRAWIPLLINSPYGTARYTGQRLQVFFKVMS